MMKIYLLTAIG